MLRHAPIFAVALALAAGVSLAAVRPNTPTPMPKVQAQMKAIVDKTSTDLFNTAGETDPANGADAKAPDAATWLRLKSDADKLKTVAAWMQKPGNGKTTDSKAAAAHDAKTLAQAANDLSDTCGGCHKIYKKQDGG